MQCPTHKQQHSLQEAKRLAKRASQNYDAPMSAYRCTECGGWHVGQRNRVPKPMRWVGKNHAINTTEERP